MDGSPPCGQLYRINIYRHKSSGAVTVAPSGTTALTNLDPLGRNIRTRENGLGTFSTKSTPVEVTPSY